MVFKVREYQHIMDGTTREDSTRNEDGFTDTRATLRGEHRAESVDKLRQPRRHQVQFIDQSKLLLHSAGKTQPEKARIMTGLMLLELAIIADSYGENIFDVIAKDLKATKPSEKSKSYQGSTYFRCLLVNIGLKPDNPLDYEDYRLLIGKAKNFIASHVYVEGASLNGFKEEHEFSKIEELSIPIYLHMCTTVSTEAEHRIITRNELKQAEELRKAEELSKKSGASTSWGFRLWSSPAPAAESEKREEGKAKEEVKAQTEEIVSIQYQ